MNTIIIKADNKITKALIGIFEAFGVAFEVKKEKESPYNPEFVEKILKSRNDSDGKLVTQDYKDELFRDL